MSDMNRSSIDISMESSDKKSTPQSTTPDQQHIRLACQACQRKKIKCDRTFPCGQCSRSGLQCAPSTRKPRARHQGKRAVDSELRSRISKLESLVESLSGEVGIQDDDHDSNDANDDASPRPKDASSTAGRYMGGQFWSSLTTEVQALREALEDEPFEDVDASNSPSTPSAQQASGEYDLIICPPGAIFVMPGALIEPNPQLSATLCNVFCEYVDRLCKIFHGPTLRAFMIDGQQYLGHDHTAPCNKLLKAVVWFAATNTMSESQCQMTFGQSRHDQIQQYKRLADVAMSQADLFTTNDFATLQALAVYIAASRMYDGSRRAWTLTALAVRIAHALGLNHENTPQTPFMTEMRRRLWQLIRFLDTYAALDRGMECLISKSSFDTPLAKNTNDADFDEHSPSIPEAAEGLTDMSYAHLIYQAVDYNMRLTIWDDKPTGETWQSRMQYAETFETQAREKYWRYCDDAIPFQRLLKGVSKSMGNAMKLRAIRPLHNHISSGTPRVDSPYVLNLAKESLTASEAIAADPETSQWRWMVWVQWHALAIALAGLCSIRDTELANAAWVIAEQAYARNVRVVADARNGMLWKPIEKLYKKASTFRDHGRSLSISKDTPAYDGNEFFNTLRGPFAPAQQQPLPPPLNHNNQPHGSMPTAGLPNGTMDLSAFATTSPLNDGMLDANLLATSWADPGNGDMSWMDFENMLADMSNPTTASSDFTSPPGFGGDFRPTLWPGDAGLGQEWGQGVGSMGYGS